MQDLAPRGPDAPTYDQQKVDRSALNPPRVGINAPLAAFGGGENVAGAFNAAAGLSDEGAKLAEMAQRNADQKQLFDAVTAIGLKRNELHMQAEATHGEAVNGLPEATRDQFTKYTNEIGSKLPAHLQGRFAHYAGTNLVHLDGAVQMHVAHENDQNEQQTYSTAIQTQQNTARLNWKTWDAEDKDNAVDFAAAGAQQAVIDFGKARNLNPAVVAAHVQKVTAQTYAGVVEAMLDNDQELTAKQAFEKYSKAGYFDGDADLKDRLAKRLDRDTKLGDAQSVGDRVFGSFYDTSTGTVHKPPETLEEAMDEARKYAKGYDPDTRKLIEAQVKERWQENIVAKKDAEDKAFNAAGDQIRKGAKLDDLKKSDLWDSLSERDKEHYEGVCQKVLKHESPYAPFNNPAVWNNITLMSDQDIQSIQKLPQDKFQALMARLVPNLTETTYGAFLNRVKGVDRAAEKPVSFMLNEREKEDLFDKLKLSGALDKAANAKNMADLKRKTEDAQSEFTGHASEFERRIQDEFVTPEHRLPTAEEFRKMRDQYILEQIKKNARVGWGTQIMRWGVYAPFMGREVGPEEIQERMKRAGIIQAPGAKVAGVDQNVRPVDQK